MTRFGLVRLYAGLIWLLTAGFVPARAADNQPPVAADINIATDKNMAVAIKLAATDPENASLSYSVVATPTNGLLSGTAPNLTYTPNAGFSGNDTFTFKANDATSDSNTATVSITVYGVRTWDYPAATPGTVKTYKVAVIMINTLTTPIADNPQTPRLEFYSPEKLGQLFFEHQYGTNSFFKEASYGKVAFEGRVVGWLDYPQAGLNANTIMNQADFYISLANAYLKYSDYDIFVVHALTEAGGSQVGWRYPQQSFTTPQGRIQNVGICWMLNSDVFDTSPLLSSNWSSDETVLPTAPWAHELVHTLGISGHSNSYNCGSAVIGTPGSTNTISAYGGVFSIMGERAFGTHPDALMKKNLGWLSDAQIPTVTSSGTYDLFPIVLNDGQTKAVQIPLNPTVIDAQSSSVFDALFLEYRTATGFDRYLERLKGSSFLSSYTSLTNIDANGVAVYMRYQSTATQATVLLDLNPTTAFNANRGIKTLGNVGKFADAILAVGRSFTHNNITITPLGPTPAGAMRVQVTILPLKYFEWSGGTFSQPFTVKDLNADPDGDSMSNLVEFAFSTDPTALATTSLSRNGPASGYPVVSPSSDGVPPALTFVRRKDFGTSGSVTYTPQFSSDLSTFYDGTETPAVVLAAGADESYEIVSVQFPALLPDGKKASFCRLKITSVP